MSTGFIPVNVGNLVANIPGPSACTPAGIMEMLRRYDIPVAGKNAVVVGRSDIVGKADGAAAATSERHGHDLPLQDADLAGECRRADILVAAMGKRRASSPPTSSSPAPPLSTSA